MMKFNILDLFCGAGGFSNGLEKSSVFETKVALDFDKQALQTFSKNFPNAKIVLGDITKKQIKDELIALSKQHGVNMIIGGPPCQGFSLKGKNLGLEDERNFLFKEYLHIVEAIKPEIFVIENVKNMYSAANGYFKNEIEKAITNMGYLVNIDILNAKNYGVPQNRERTIVIASKSKLINMPNPSNKLVSVEDAISDLSYLNSSEGEFCSNYKLNAKSKYQNIMRNSEFLYNHIATNHSKIAIEKLKMIPEQKGKEYLPKELHGKQKFSTTWARLEWNKISPTIDTRFDTPSNGKNSHPYLHRAITPREAARLQSFSDDFIFYGSKVAICKQIGNAVPPLLAKAIGEQIINEYSSQSVQKENYTIYCGNAYTFYNELIKNGIKVNHIITDPPYNISTENNFNTLSSRQGIDFGNWDKNFDLFSWIEKYEKILDKNGSMIIFCSYRYISHIIETMEKSNIVVKDILVWQKSNPMPRNTQRRYVQDMEFAIWGVKKDAKWVFNKDKNIPYLRSLFSFPTVLGKERTQHPTQKSLKLFEELIKIHTNENDIVLDPFMGSATTGLASIKHNRKFIGIELNKEYFTIAKDRFINLTN